ncbi:MAG: CDP-diacylglycerol--glycerol-3-phosphate 3-phosphatidyltransferase [Myxococcaceae bacterium]|nr:CDP-diacylglycerol--glycerol-3-phosphate 3-phosphatidyltransferase [Myxococcaceae bacterium]
MSVDRAARRKAKKEERARRRAERRRRPSILVEQFWNVPNLLTLLRILAIPLFVWFTYDADPWYSVWAAAIFALASITDVIDGYLARKWNQMTVVGKLLDPLADKLIVTAAFVMMVRLGRIAAWVVIVLLAREFIITGLRSIAASEGIIISAGQEGKWKTSFQLTGIIALCIHYTHPLWLVFWTFDVDYNLVGKTLIYVATALSVWSAGVYFRDFLTTLAKRGSSPAS